MGGRFPSSIVLPGAFVRNRFDYNPFALFRPKPDAFSLPGYQFDDSHFKGMQFANNVKPAIVKISKSSKDDHANKPKPGKPLLTSYYIIDD